MWLASSMRTCGPVTAQLREIYEQQHAAASRRDPAVVPRELRSDLTDAELFLVGQALGRDTQRLSGLPYVFPGGPPYRLSKGGAVLDNWLSDVGYTIDPSVSDRRYAYHARSARSVPGSEGFGDRRRGAVTR